MPNVSAQVEGFIRKNKPFQPHLEKLRALVLQSGLTEAIKWRTPCYTLNDANVLFISAMKGSALISFLKGVLMKDPKKLLEIPGENTQGARVIRFTTVEEIEKLAPTLKAYIKEAIAIEQAGLKIPFQKIEERAVPEEIQQKFDADPAFKKAFQSLTPGRQRAYYMFISSAKQPQTRQARLAKVTPRILAGKGLDD